MSIAPKAPLIVKTRDPAKAFDAIDMALTDGMNFRGIELYSHSASRADYVQLILMLAFLPKSVVMRISHIDTERNDGDDTVAVSLAEGFRSHADAVVVVEHLAGAGEVVGHGAIVALAGGVAFEDLVVPPCDGEGRGYFVTANWHSVEAVQ